VVVVVVVVRESDRMRDRRDDMVRDRCMGVVAVRDRCIVVVVVRDRQDEAKVLILQDMIEEGLIKDGEQGEISEDRIVG
jgi:hypothetical protein